MRRLSEGGGFSDGITVQVISGDTGKQVRRLVPFKDMVLDEEDVRGMRDAETRRLLHRRRLRGLP